MKYLLHLAFSAVFLLSSGIRALSADLADLIQRVEVSVVRIDITTEDGEAVGSGFVVSADGIIITNHHVIVGATEGTVTFNTGKTARIRGTLRLIKEQDIAVIKIDETDLTPLEIETNLPRKGTEVVAFGAPRGLSFSASEGIVSGVRSSEELAEFGGNHQGTWIQTTTPISPGNSGGPLVNSDGKVVGANTMSLVVGQNVNFATSCENLLKAMKGIQSQTVVPLRQGAGRISPEATARVGHGELPPREIDPAVIEQFIGNGRDLLPSGVAIVQKRLKEHQSVLRAMKAGTIGAKAKQGAERGYDYFVATVRNQLIFQFPDREAKKRTIDKQAAVIDRFEVLLHRLDDPKVGIYYFLTEVGGPSIPLNSSGQVGWLRDATVSQVVGGDSVHAYVGDTRIEVRGVRGLVTDSTVEPMLVYSCATRTYETRGRGENTVIVVRELPKSVILSALKIDESELTSPSANRPEAVAASKPPAEAKAGTPATTRRWRDHTGKFDIEAAFVAQDDADAILRTKSGKVIKVPKTKLSTEDQSFLRTLSGE